MTRLVVVTVAAVGLILFVTFVITRLLRSRARGLSIRMQVFLALAFIVGSFAFGLGVLVIDRVEARAQRLAQAAALDEAHAIAALVESEMQRTQVPFENLAGQLERWAPGVYAPGSNEPAGLELLTPDGRMLFPAGKPSRAAEKGAVWVDVPVQDGGVVRVVKPTIVVQALLADFAPSVLVLSLVLGAAAAVAAAWIGQTIAAPIEALSEFAEHVSHGERTALPLRVAGREVRLLVSSIDTMQKKLEGRPFVETFAADLSHELKNPVAAIRASAEVLEEGALEEPERARKFVGRIAEASLRIERLLAELLHLAQVETRGAEKLARVDLKALLYRSLAALEANAERVHVELPPGDVSVRGDELWLSRAFGNLLDNALVHSAEGTPVTARLGAEGAHVSFSTDNAGAISPHVRGSLFRRFVTTRRDRGGTGLGLAIVRAVAEAHGGQVEVRAPGPPRVVIELRLPRA